MAAEAIAKIPRSIVAWAIIEDGRVKHAVIDVGHQYEDALCGLKPSPYGYGWLWHSTKLPTLRECRWCKHKLEPLED